MPANIYFFNPTCEMAVANGQASYMPPAKLREFEEDLQSLPLWLACRSDFVLLRNTLCNKFINKIKQYNPDIPEFISIKKSDTSEIISELRPWGWSPNAYKVFEPFKDILCDEWKNNPMSNWENNKRILLSRHTGLKMVEAMLDISKKHSSLLEISHAPSIIYTHTDIKTISDKIPLPVLLKTPWSASGRGLFHINQQSDAEELCPRLQSALKQQGHLFAERLLHKVQDISFHFVADETGYRFLGHTYFKTDNFGRFEGCYLGKPNNEILEHIPLNESILCATELIKESLERMELNKSYHGPVGIDGIFYFNANKQLKLHPCIEVNLRYTMGLVNLMLAKKLQVHPNSGGYWKIHLINNSQWEKLSALYPVVMCDGMISDGILELTPPPTTEGFMAYLTIENQHT